ncbi:hypothetical protein QQ045_017666 [Rhodiola kirilowii]
MAKSWKHGERVEVRVFEDEDELSRDLVDYIADLSEAAVKERGSFAIALSGGSLISLIGKLCESPHNQTMYWSKWYVFWVDERMVSKNHLDIDVINYKSAKEGFFSKVPVSPSHVTSINNTVSAEKAANGYMFAIRQFVKARTIDVSDICDCPKFDLILLNMGPDGHVASLFPNHPVLKESDEWIAFILDSPKPPPERITFTLPVINSAANVAIVATGGSKADAAHEAIDEKAEHPSLPAALVNPSIGKLVWFLDDQAASKLDNYKLSE